MIAPSVAELHHQVLPFWSQIARKNKAPLSFILTLDHHTDILPAFSRMPNPPVIDPEHPEAAVRLLCHDEHIDWALRAGIMQRSIVISHENFTVPAHPAMTVRCSEHWPAPQEILNSSPEAVHAAGLVLESSFLLPLTSDLNLAEPYILDIDLDYFLCETALHPQDPSRFLELAAHARGITISMERDWQRLLRLRGETLDSGAVLAGLNRMFSRISA